MVFENDILKYFSQPGFRRLFQGIRRKFASLGRIGGKVQLRNLNLEELEVLEGFFGRSLNCRTSLTVELAEVDRIIRESRFAIGLEELLPLYFREELRSKREMALEQETEWERFFDDIKGYARRAETREWLRTIREGNGAGYRTFLGLYRENRDEAQKVLRACIQALDELPALNGERRRRTVFAARLTGTPHGMDRNTWLGRLLYSGILFVLGESAGSGGFDNCTPVEKKPDQRADGLEAAYGSGAAAGPGGNAWSKAAERRRPAEKVRHVFSRAGLEEDDLSSNVITAGLRTEPGDPRAGLFESAWHSRSPLILPLRFFDQETRWFPFESVYVLENPTVLSAILDAWEGPGCPPLVCPSGQPSVAGLRLMDQLAANGTRICYSGDFDWKGLEIGIALWHRYKALFAPWFFDAGAYEKAAAGVPLSQEQANRVGGLGIPWDRQLGDRIIDRGCVVFQEALVEDMVEFLKKRGKTPV